MIYTIGDKGSLSTLKEVISFLLPRIRQHPIRHQLPLENRIDNRNLFVVTRTASGRTTFKPNITKQAVLFSGVSHFQDPLTSQILSEQRPNFLATNVRREEFEIAMESYPLYNMLRRGITFGNHRIIIENPYGLAMSYGFPTLLFPLTSSLDIAAYISTRRRSSPNRASVRAAVSATWSRNCPT